MNIRIRRTGLTAVAALTAAALAGCASTAPESEPQGSMATLTDDEQVTIVFESYNLASTGGWSDTILALIDEFMDEHPNIIVETQPSSSASTGGSVQQQILAGGAPDVAQLTFNELDFAANTLGAQNLTALVGAERLAEAFEGEYPYHERARVLGDWDGDTYGIPYVFSTPVLWINESILEEAGLDPEAVDLSSWDSVEEVGEQISEVTGAPSVSISCTVTGGSWCMQGLFLSNGAQVLSDDRTTIEFGSPAAIDTVQRFRDMFDAGVLASQDGASMYEAFAQGNTAIHVNTSALQAAFMGGSSAGGWTLSARTLPAFEGHDVIPTNSGSFLAIFSTDPKKQAAAWELIQWMTSAHAYESISIGIGYLPLRSSLTEEGGALYEWVEANPLVKPNLEQLNDLQPWVSYPGDSYSQVDSVLATALEESIFYGSDPATTMQTAAERAQGLIE